MNRAVASLWVTALLAAAGCKAKGAETPTVYPSPQTTEVAASTRYLEGCVDALGTALPTPPVDRDLISRGEIDLMLAMQSEATDAARSRAKSEESISAWSYSDVLGEKFSRSAMPLTSRLIKQCDQDTRVIVDLVKAKWSRARPTVQDPRIALGLSPPKSVSYPSGHAIQSTVWARMLGLLAPEKKEALLQRARVVSYGRVIGGVHFPSDVVAGMALGNLIADRLEESPEFLSDLEAARSEWRN